MLQMDRIRKVYRTDLIETHALEEVSMRVRPGEFVAVMGPSGSGKTTFLNVAGLLDTFTSGSYVLDGKDVSRLTDDEMSRIRNQKIGFVFQMYNLLPKASVQRNVELPMLYAGVSRRERKRRAIELLEQVGIPEKARSLPSTLSGGQRQRVAIARALANRPAMLLADEPTGALDSRTGHEVLELMSELHRAGNTILIVTHDLAIAGLASRQVEIHDGRIASSTEQVA
jgi:putative ABC transport system ATP-binding protein